jgi:hypothetical protein
LEQYPNWEYALDEESIEGQDETTIRPSAVQSELVLGVAYTAGFVTQANGERLPAILELECGKIEGVTVYTKGYWAWALRRLGRAGAWTPITYEWLPEFERPPSVLLSDPTIFPLIIESKLPASTGNPPVSVSIQRSSTLAAG